MGLLQGPIIQGYNSYRDAKAKNKAQKEKIKQMQIALMHLYAGSSDALGNKLSADPSGHWKYDLTYSTNKAKQAADRANVLLGTTANKTSDQLRRQNTFGNQLANTITARANQNAAMRSGARTNSNLGTISNSFGQAGSQKLRDNYVQGLKNSQNAVNYNANMRSNLANAAQNAAAPINSVQNNLQQMVNGLNKAGMGQINDIAANIKPKQQTMGAYFKGMDQSLDESLDQATKLMELWKNFRALQGS